MFQANFYQTWKMVLALIVIPCACMGLVVSIVLILPNQDWILIAGTVIGMGASLFFTLTAVGKLVVQKCTVTPGKTGITVTMEKTMPLFAQNFHLPWLRIKNASADIDPNTNKLFLQIKAQGYPGNFMLSPENKEITEVEEWDLWKAIEAEIANYNSNPAFKNKISGKSFYGGIWAKLLAVVINFVFLAAIVSKILGNANAVEWYKILWLGSIGLVFSIAVLKARKKEKLLHKAQVQAMNKPTNAENT